MNLTYDSLLPVPPAAHTAHSRPEDRTHQGIPGIETLPSGRLLASWYTGGTTECRENYVVLACSDDDGATWREVDAVIDPPGPDVRAFDPTLWLAPDGRLFWFWAQGCGCDSGISGIVDEVFDGLEGVWFSVIENPDDPDLKFRFTPPRRIADGIMLNKPTVLTDGTWFLPASLWSVPSAHREFHRERRPVYGAQTVVSEDHGRTFTLRSAVDVTVLTADPSFDEHQFVEQRDGRLACYVRCLEGIGRCFSGDGGRTWSRLAIAWDFCQDTRFCIRRLASGRLLLAANNGGKIRKNLTVFLSEDDGATWTAQLLLDEREGVSYPDFVQDAAGVIYLSYDYRRTQGGFLYLAKFTEADILAGKLGAGSFAGREISHSKPVPAAESADGRNDDKN